MTGYFLSSATTCDSCKTSTNLYPASWAGTGSDWKAVAVVTYDRTTSLLN